MNLDDWRSRINDLDNQILDLLTQRAEAALQIGDLKRRQDAPSYAPEREADIVRRLIEKHRGPLVSDTLICGELKLEITHHLLSRAAELDEVKRVVSHPQALAQCRGWLAEHLAEVATEETLSTAVAAELAAADATVAAIASELAAQLYNVPVLESRIEDNPQNATRFLVVGRRPIGPTGRDKTSILFAMRNVPGALYRILEPLARDGINLTKIESRPARQSPWEYVIFVDLEGHRETHQIAAVLREMGERTLFLKVLGSYPAA